MDSNLARNLPTRRAWCMPVRPEQYDRHPLSLAERNALAVHVDEQVPINSTPRRAAEAVLLRLTRPLHEV